MSQTALVYSADANENGARPAVRSYSCFVPNHAQHELLVVVNI